MLRFLYSLLTWILLPLGLLRLLLRSRKAPAYRQRWQERLGYYPPLPSSAAPVVVFHAVSVGEVHAAQPLLEAFMQARPDIQVVLTTATPTGSARVQALFAQRVIHVYLPWDFPAAVNRFLQWCKPRMLVLLETELWPNLLLMSKQAGCKVVLANARLSEKSFSGYQRFAQFSAQLMQALTLVAAQSDADAQRFVALGLRADQICVNGSLKFDVSLDERKIARAQRIRQTLASRPVWIAASTREGEDEKIFMACQQILKILPDALLVIVPRHPERFETAAEQAQAAGLRVQRFSHETEERSEILPTTQVLLGDTMGDMVLYYKLADVAFVGGSLVPTGCQNIIEPAALGIPVLTGPSLFNFQKVSELLIHSGAMQVVGDEQVLAQRLIILLQDTALRQEMGAQGLAEVARNQGAAERLNELLLGFV